MITKSGFATWLTSPQLKLLQESDLERRRLERRSLNDPEMQVKDLKTKLRTHQITEKDIELAAMLGDEASISILGQRPWYDPNYYASFYHEVFDKSDMSKPQILKFVTQSFAEYANDFATPETKPIIQAILNALKTGEYDKQLQKKAILLRKKQHDDESIKYLTGLTNALFIIPSPDPAFWASSALSHLPEETQHRRYQRLANLILGRA